MIERNRNPAGCVFMIIFAIAELVDGAIRLLSLGFLHTTLPLDVSRTAARVAIFKMKRKQYENQNSRTDRPRP